MHGADEIFFHCFCIGKHQIGAVVRRRNKQPGHEPGDPRFCREHAGLMCALAHHHSTFVSIKGAHQCIQVTRPVEKSYAVLDLILVAVCCQSLSKSREFKQHVYSTLILRLVHIEYLNLFGDIVFNDPAIERQVDVIFIDQISQQLRYHPLGTTRSK